MMKNSCIHVNHSSMKFRLREMFFAGFSAGVADGAYSFGHRSRVRSSARIAGGLGSSPPSHRSLKKRRLSNRQPSEDCRSPSPRPFGRSPSTRLRWPRRKAALVQQCTLSGVEFRDSNSGSCTLINIEVESASSQHLESTDAVIPKTVSGSPYPAAIVRGLGENSCYRAGQHDPARIHPQMETGRAHRARDRAGTFPRPLPARSTIRRRPRTTRPASTSPSRRASRRPAAATVSPTSGRRAFSPGNTRRRSATSTRRWNS